MRVWLIKLLTNVGLSIFNLGCDLAFKWDLEDEIWLDYNPIEDDDEPPNPFDDVSDMDSDPVAKWRHDERYGY